MVHSSSFFRSDPYCIGRSSPMPHLQTPADPPPCHRFLFTQSRSHPGFLQIPFQLALSTRLASAGASKAPNAAGERGFARREARRSFAFGWVRCQRRVRCLFRATNPRTSTCDDPSFRTSLQLVAARMEVPLPIIPAAYPHRDCAVDSGIDAQDLLRPIPPERSRDLANTVE